MKWTYSIRNKMTAAILLAVVLCLTMLINLVERKRFKELDQSFSSIYEDRLLAENYLFHLYKNIKNEQDFLHAQLEQGGQNKTKAQLDQYRADRGKLLAKYDETFLTEEEEKKYIHLKEVLLQINQLERQIVAAESDAELSVSLVHLHDQRSADAYETLSALSDIQTAEGASLRNKSKKIIVGSVSSSHLQMAILLIIAVIIQALVFSSKTVRKTEVRHGNPSLN